jgi:hypothetical protein
VHAGRGQPLRNTGRSTAASCEQREKATGTIAAHQSVKSLNNVAFHAIQIYHEQPNVTPITKGEYNNRNSVTDKLVQIVRFQP